METLARLLEGPAAAARFHCAALAAARVWALVAALVSRAPPAYLTPQLLAAVRRLVCLLRAHQPAVAADAEETLLLDAAVWAHAPAPVHRDVVSFLPCPHSEERLDLLRSSSIMHPKRARDRAKPALEKVAHVILFCTWKGSMLDEDRNTNPALPWPLTSPC